MEQRFVQAADRETAADTLELRYFPVSFFAIVLGLIGTVIATQRTTRLLGLSLPIGNILLVIALNLFLVGIVCYAIKAIRYPDIVRAEFLNPARTNFFPTISLSLLSFSVAVFPMNPGNSQILWMLGVAVHTLLMAAILSIWMQRADFQIRQVNPSWFIPIVGNMLIPIVGVWHAPPELSWLFFSFGLIVWMALLAIVFYRLIFHGPLEERLTPTLFLTIAPPALGFIGYVRLMEHDIAGFGLDGISKVLYYFALCMLLVLITQYRRFVRIRFFLSWWAYSFPLAALTSATAFMAEKTGLPLFSTLAGLLLIVLILVIGLLLIKTVAAMLRRELFVADA